MISIIAVVGKNNGIGYKNKLLWDIPADMEHFKKITTGHIIVVGEKTFQSIGKPLPNRENIIITLNKNYKADGCKIVHSVDDLLKISQQKKNKEIFIIGGGQIYNLFISYANKLYLTIVDDKPKADTFFPDYSEFKNIISKQSYEQKGLKFIFLELKR